MTEEQHQARENVIHAAAIRAALCAGTRPATQQWVPCVRRHRGREL